MQKKALKLFYKEQSNNLISVCVSKKNPYFNIVEKKEQGISQGISNVTSANSNTNENDLSNEKEVIRLMKEHSDAEYLINLFAINDS